jgi:hypothetical protein
MFLNGIIPLVALASLLSTSARVITPVFNGTVQGRDISFTQLKSDGTLAYQVTSPHVRDHNAFQFGGWRAFDGNSNTRAVGYNHYNATTGIPSCGNGAWWCRYRLEVTFPRGVPVNGLTFRFEYPQATYATDYSVFGISEDGRRYLIFNKSNQSPRDAQIESGNLVFRHTVDDTSNRYFPKFVLEVNSLNAQPSLGVATRIPVKIIGFHMEKTDLPTQLSDCDIVLNIWKQLKPGSDATNGCTLNGVSIWQDGSSVTGL